MNGTRYWATLVLALLVGVAGCDGADGGDADAGAPAAEQPGQPGQPQQPQQMDQETAERLMEIQSIQQRLQPVQQEALQDPALASRLEEIQTRVESAMREEGDDVMQRSDALRQELAEAQAEGDQDRMQELMREAQGLQMELQALQASVLERPELRQPVEEFEAAQRERMIEIEPEAEQLLDRMDELIAELQQAEG